MSITITPADVGRKVRLRNGETVFIANWFKGELYPVLADGLNYTEHGKFFAHRGEDSVDIIAFADEPETQITFTRKSPMVNPTDFGEEDSEPSAPTDQHKQIWLTAFTEYVKSGKGVDHAAAAANAAVEAFKKFERGE